MAVQIFIITTIQEIGFVINVEDFSTRKEEKKMEIYEYGSRFCFECPHWTSHDETAVGNCKNKTSDYFGCSTGATHRCTCMPDIGTAPTHVIQVREKEEHKPPIEKNLYQYQKTNAWATAKAMAMDAADAYCEDKVHGVKLYFWHADDWDRIRVKDAISDQTVIELTVKPVNLKTDHLKLVAERAADTMEAVIHAVIDSFLEKEIEMVNSDTYNIKMDYHRLRVLLLDDNIKSYCDMEADEDGKYSEHFYHEGDQIELTGSLKNGCFKLEYERTQNHAN